MSGQQRVAHAATTGFDNASAYDIHRPSYPPEVVQSLLSRLDVAHKPNAKIVDLAAGTGKFTELLATRKEEYAIVAIEPVAKMRDGLVDKKLERVEVRDGLATRMDVGDGWADAVIAAQPRNWAASTQWEDQMKQLVLALPPDDVDRFRDDKWGKVFERQSRAADPYFTTPIGQDKVPFTVWRTKELLWDRINTLSQIAVLEGNDKETFRARFDEILEHGDQVWNKDREVEFHGFTTFGWTTRL
ncbi:hypothetical protein QQS21_012355 [Conoideocrella luteorostrata]|uniref:Methyltransferase domain-containing protein n=1 Tax=Conoideocrella luteorostrata TaxID=1105319 RepID=A0AAJ0FSI6_9HYPO|nr:hypothetical protein QQS21_012355 [Conoideocrella luteorostrata]